MIQNVVIIGSGPAGLTAGIYTARAGLKPLLIAGMMPGGLLTTTSSVENFPGFPEGVNGFELIDAMRTQAERFGVEFEYDAVASVELTDGKIHTIRLEGGAELQTRALIIATGSTPRWLGLPSEGRLRNHGVSSCATCDGAFYRGKPVAVVGGGDSAVEEATYLAGICSKVTLIHRRDQLRASKIMAERAMANPKIDILWDSAVEEVLGDPKVSGLRVRNLKTDAAAVVPCDALFVALGHTPATGVFKGQLDMDPQGYLKVDAPSTRTNLTGVFAAGDCADADYRQAIAAAGAGCRAAVDVERYLAY